MVANREPGSYIYIYMYICSPHPPKIYFLHPFVCPKFYQKAFYTIKRKNKKTKTTKKTKKTKTLGNLWLRRFPQGFVFFCVFWSFCFFCFFCVFFCFFWGGVRFTVASDIFLKKHFPSPAFSIHYFPKNGFSQNISGNLF